MMAYESAFRPIELPAGLFDRYLADEGLDGPRAARAKSGAAAGPGRERYARCAKTWLMGTGRARAAERATHVLGLRFELVPGRVPSAPGESLTVRALFQGRPLTHALVRAWRRPIASGWAPASIADRDSVAPVAEGRTDAEGLVTLRIHGAGEWLINSVHMVPSAAPEEADWESYWASLTFAK
jgi:uncharacterized GH25 family protein